MIHDFQERLAWSAKAGDEPFWNAVYRKAFPNMVNHVACPGDTASQRMGIDRVVILSNGKMISIDEKKREKDYGDILLEYISVDTTNAPGWIAKDLSIDYLAYAIIPSKKCYLFPWPLLRRVWLRFGQEWIAYGKQQRDGFTTISAANKGYKTLSVSVPLKVLQRQLQNAQLIDVSAELEQAGWWES